MCVWTIAYMKHKVMYIIWVIKNSYKVILRQKQFKLLLFINIIITNDAQTSNRAI